MDPAEIADATDEVIDLMAPPVAGSQDAQPSGPEEQEEIIIDPRPKTARGRKKPRTTEQDVEWSRAEQAAAEIREAIATAQLKVIAPKIAVVPVGMACAKGDGNPGGPVSLLALQAFIVLQAIWGGQCGSKIVLADLAAAMGCEEEMARLAIVELRDGRRIAKNGTGFRLVMRE